MASVLRDYQQTAVDQIIKTMRDACAMIHKKVEAEYASPRD